MSAKQHRERPQTVKPITGSRNKPPHLDEGTLRSIYDGQDRLGHVLQRERGFVAYDRQRRPIGTYDTALEAAQAVMRRELQRGALRT
jgi:hypothetical protein